ncbi:hypothetical protein OBBRIDRAFT_795794 [Obba rivulosa]|uniref:Uncharacterized protein n=1 Tax=Obba rivulosa TaxID=1052685 RepID=A0A8E2DH80_9APHY|nr:hypothetical protein OBBRIDRAFT_795794 [Obba rivulosa]
MPFCFWPVSYTPGYWYDPEYIIHNEYGSADNTSRPGGPMATAVFASDSNNSTFMILADNSTVASLISSIAANCTYNNGSSSSVPLPYNGSSTSPPLPEQVIQYYRASSAALTLDGYNNTYALEGNSTTVVPLPSWVDVVLLSCLNDTIGEGIPLISAADANCRTLMSLGLLIASILCCLVNVFM